MKKLAITPIQCAEGGRIVIMLKRLGIDEELFQSFISNIYERCQNSGIKQDDIARWVGDLVQFSDKFNTHVPLLEIPNHIEQLMVKITKLQDKLLALEAEIRLKEEALKDKKVAEDLIARYSKLEKKVEGHGICVKNENNESVNENLERLVSLIDSLSEMGYDPNKVLSMYKDKVFLEHHSTLLSNQISEKSNLKMNLETELFIIKEKLDKHRLRLSIYNQLEILDFGLNELQILYDTITEIAFENSIPYSLAIPEFFKLVESLFPAKLKNINLATMSRSFTISNTENKNINDNNSDYIK